MYLTLINSMANFSNYDSVLYLDCLIMSHYLAMWISISLIIYLNLEGVNFSGNSSPKYFSKFSKSIKDL